MNEELSRCPGTRNTSSSLDRLERSTRRRAFPPTCAPPHGPMIRTDRRTDLSASGRRTRGWRIARGALAAIAVPCTTFAAPQSQKVAEISTIAPAASDYVLEATLPVPPGTFLPGQTTMPLAIESGGQAVPTQVEIVSRYPDANDGADVVELIARVDRPAGAQPGDEITFDVVTSDHTPGSFDETVAVADLFDSPDGVSVVTRDLFGNVYRANLLERVTTGHATVEMVRDGELVRETRSHEVMLPSRFSGTGSLAPHPHMLGIHVFTTRYSGEEFFTLDVLFHNGLSGDHPLGHDEPIHDAYLSALHLILPGTWDVAWAIDNPMVGPSNTTPGGSSREILEHLPHGQFHVVPQQAQFQRRYVLAPNQSAMNRGLEVLHRGTRGFCVPGPRPSQASANPTDDLWSWWNEGTARYLTSNNRLPHLDHLSRSSVADSIRMRYQPLAQQVASGAPGVHPTFAPNFGWGQPYGIPYGGMTGGDEIEMVPGIDVAWARVPLGIRWLDLFSKSYLDRQPYALFDVDGKAPVVEEHIVNPGSPNAYVPSYFNMDPSGNDNYFGFKTVDLRFAENAYMTSRVPYYEKDLKDYDFIDLQHLTRFLNPNLALTWLANDSLAKLQIELAASLFRFSFHNYYNTQYLNVQGTGLLERMDDVSENPGQGADFGRGPAWGIVAATARYATGPDDERARLAPWFEIIQSTARDGQSLCTGNPSALPIARNFKGGYQSRQSFEVGFMLNASHSMRTTVFEDVNPVMADMARDYIEDGAYSTTIEPFWHASLNGQVSLIACRPGANMAPEFCLNIPANGYSQHFFIDRTTAMPAWSYSYRVAQDGIFLQRAAEALTGSAGGNLEAALLSMGLDRLYEWAPMLSLLQEL